MHNHVEVSLDRIRIIFQRVSDKIEAMKTGDKIPATALAAEIGRDYGMTGAQMYPILSILIKDYPGIMVRRGAHGGIIKLAAPEITSTPPSETLPSEENDIEHNEIIEEFVKETLPIINS